MQLNTQRLAIDLCLRYWIRPKADQSERVEFCTAFRGRLVVGYEWDGDSTPFALLPTLRFSHYPYQLKNKGVKSTVALLYGFWLRLLGSDQDNLLEKQNNC